MKNLTFTQRTIEEVARLTRKKLLLEQKIHAKEKRLNALVAAHTNYNGSPQKSAKIVYM